MKFRDFTLGQSDDADTGEFEMLVKRRHIGLIAADAVERLGQHNFELARLGILQQRLDTRA